MNIIAYAVPFFILSMLFELAYGLFRGRNTYRLNDSVGSLFLGTLSQARRFRRKDGVARQRAHVTS